LNEEGCLTCQYLGYVTIEDLEQAGLDALQSGGVTHARYMGVVLLLRSVIMRSHDILMGVAVPPGSEAIADASFV
jgi:hypothetical protein